MRSRTLWAFTAALYLWVPVLLAHEADHMDHSDRVHQREKGRAQVSRRSPDLLLPPIGLPRPWTSKPALTDPDRFQIAIIADRTGGHRPGVWMDAMKKLNLLRPDFVVSVGDLIEGYTNDRQQAESEWRELLGFIDQLEMKFFFVAGNHDVSNSMLHAMWREKFGPEWYSFNYRGVHFLCLCSEDPIEHRISKEQLEFVRADLAENSTARHTLVFMHNPLWTYAEKEIAAGRGDPTNWKTIERLLANRPHTVFAGHVHHYVSYERNGGRKYYSLATTGGGSRMRGNGYGEFDHVVWVTMEKSGPQIVNLRLDGILPPDVVTEASANRLANLLKKCSLEVAPILLEVDDGFSEGIVQLRLTNEVGERIRVEGQLSGLPLKGVSVSPQHISLEVGPTGVAQQSIRIKFDELIPFSEMAALTFVADMQTFGETPIIAKRIFPVLIDRKHKVSSRHGEVLIDGNLREWGELKYSTPQSPLVLGQSNTWQGNSDASLSFAARCDDSMVHLGIQVNDDRIVQGDAVRLILDGRPLQTRLLDPRVRLGTKRILVSAPTPVSSVETDIDAVKTAGVAVQGGYQLEVSFPSNWLNELQGEWDSFQLALQIEDVDEQGSDPAIVLWRGGPSYQTLNSNYGTFVRE